jgi:hypothetical protein
MYFPAKNCEITKLYNIVKPRKSTAKGHQICRHTIKQSTKQMGAPKNLKFRRD